LTSAFWGNSRDTALPFKLLAFVDKNKQIAAFGRISRTVAVVGTNLHYRFKRRKFIFLALSLREVEAFDILDKHTKSLLCFLLS